MAESFVHTVLVRSGDQHITLEEYFQNLIGMALASAVRIYATSFHPVGSTPRGDRIWAYGGSSLTKTVLLPDSPSPDGSTVRTFWFGSPLGLPSVESFLIGGETYTTDATEEDSVFLAEYDLNIFGAPHRIYATRRARRDWPPNTEVEFVYP